jgi:hypothetical protein
VDKQDINITQPKPNNDLILYRLDEIKGELVDIKLHYVTKTESELLKQEIESLRKDVKDLKLTTSTEIERLKGKKQFRDTLLWVGLTASAIINIVAMYNLFTKDS